MTVVVNGMPFQVHSCVMRHGSDYFRGLLAIENVPDALGKYHIVFRERENGVGCREFRVVLDFIYTGHAIVSASELKAVGQWKDECTDVSILVVVMQAADFLSLDSMLDAYTQLFRQRLTPETVIEGLIEMGDNDGLHMARKVATEYFVENVTLVEVRRKFNENVCLVRDCVLCATDLRVRRICKTDCLRCPSLRFRMSWWRWRRKRGPTARSRTPLPRSTPA